MLFKKTIASLADRLHRARPHAKSLINRIKPLAGKGAELIALLIEMNALQLLNSKKVSRFLRFHPLLRRGLQVGVFIANSLFYLKLFRRYTGFWRFKGRK